MNEEKVKLEIGKLVLRQKPWRQLPASKAQLAELERLGLLGLMPRQAKGGQVGYQDAARVLSAAAQDGSGVVGGFNAAGEGDVERREPSALYCALHEAPDSGDPAPAPDTPDTPAPAADDDTGGDDDPDTGGDDPAEEALQRLIDQVSAAEDAAFNAAQERLVEALWAEEARLDDMWPLSHFAALAKADTLRRAALEGRLKAEKIGRDWLTTEREVRKYLAAHPPRSGPHH